MALSPELDRITNRIVKRSEKTRRAYLDRMDGARKDGPKRAHLTCGNQAHAYAPMGDDQERLMAGQAGNIGIITAYNDMLSAHPPISGLP